MGIYAQGRFSEFVWRCSGVRDWVLKNQEAATANAWSPSLKSIVAPLMPLAL
jgi:hypothetical protein